MKADTAEFNAGNLQGWVFYDAECSFCLRGAARWSGMFARRGFVWTPLQTPGTAARTNLTEDQLRDEMKLLLADWRLLGGVDAWRTLFRSVWWLWPLGFLLALPGIHAFGAALYRWTARHRYCLGGQCSVAAGNQNHRRHRAFFELP